MCNVQIKPRARDIKQVIKTDITLFDMLNNIKNKKRSKEDRGGILVEHLYYWAFRLKSKV